MSQKLFFLTERRDDEPVCPSPIGYPKSSLISKHKELGDNSHMFLTLLNIRISVLPLSWPQTLTMKSALYLKRK